MPLSVCAIVQGIEVRAVCGLVKAKNRPRQPSPEEALACESASTSNTFFSKVANDAARLMAVVVFPTPPFWLAKAMILLIY